MTKGIYTFNEGYFNREAIFKVDKQETTLSTLEEGRKCKHPKSIDFVERQ